MMKPKLKFMLDYGANPLWSNDDFTRQKFGNNIDNLKDLGLSDSTIELSNLLTELYWDRLNPIYQMLPSFWSGEMHLLFQTKLRQLFNCILTEINNDYEIENMEEALLNEMIDITKINSELRDFLFDPITYYRTNNISFSAHEEEEKLKMDLEFKKWKQKEITLLE